PPAGASPVPTTLRPGFHGFGPACGGIRQRRGSLPPAVPGAARAGHNPPPLAFARRAARAGAPPLRSPGPATASPPQVRPAPAAPLRTKAGAAGGTAAAPRTGPT